MIVFPGDIFQKLEFDKLLALLQEDCLGEPGVRAFQNPEILTDAVLIRRLLWEVNEFKNLLDANVRFPMGNYSDLSEDFKMLAIEGYVLSERSLKDLAVQLRIVRDIFRWFKVRKDAATESPYLFAIVKEIVFDESLLVEIERIIDENGEIRPNASPELSRLRRATLSRRKDLEREFRSIINKYAGKGWLSDTVETIRNGRRVLAVPAEYKRQIRGIIHDESDTGKTAYIEPEGVIDINNDIFDLEHEERREIFRILRELSNTLRPSTRFLKMYQDVLVRFDIIQAKAHFGSRMNATMPVVHEGPHFSLYRVRHPLLLFKNKKDGKKTVPFNFHFTNGNRILLLSGPNAGGKSVCMKAVGLIQLMFQTGMLVPADEGAEMGIFHRFFTDIGDQQSLEDELSTYSSRLRNAKFFLENADPQTLVLIDEFGSGTDPKAGGAIAEAVLKELNEKQVWGVVTTHYSNLKLYAYRNKGVVNGAMIFDKETLSPTYQLRIGKPGSSYAFEIARKNGFGDEILAYATSRMGEAEKNFDDLLVNLQQEKQEALEHKISLLEEREKLDRLIKNYDRLNQDIEMSRKRIRLEVREKAMAEMQEQSKELTQLIKELRSADHARISSEKADALIRRQKEEEKKMTEVLDNIKEDIFQKMESEVPGGIREGSEVRLRAGGTMGVVESISRNDAIVIVGNMRLQIKLRDLEYVPPRAEPTPKTESFNMDALYRQASFDATLDIRGMYTEEAVRTVEEFVDRALMSSANMLQIIHGKGTGALRNLVRQKLRAYRDIKTIRNADPKDGGDGVTVVVI